MADIAQATQDILNDTDMISYGGCDMMAHVAGKPCGTLEAVTVSITREVLPKYAMGNPEFRSVVKGKRGIAGSMVFTTFDKHALLRGHFADNSGSLLYGQSLMAVNRQRILDQINSTYNQYPDIAGGAVAANQNSPENYGITDPSNLEQLKDELRSTFKAIMQRRVQYVDQIPPFDVTLTMVNSDNGATSFFRLRGVVLLNEGFGFSMDDLSSDTAYSYIARSVTPLTRAVVNSQWLA